MIFFFRCCTEFENNATAILRDNNYSRSGGIMNVANDYYRINQALKLDKYEIRLNIWENGPLTLIPFQQWGGTVYEPLPWYQNYNKVKHNRTLNFHLANFENLLLAAAGLFVTLYAQYAYLAFSPYQSIGMTGVEDGFVSGNDCLFEVKPFNWSAEEMYQFDWNTLKITSNPFDNFSF